METTHQQLLNKYPSVHHARHHYSRGADNAIIYGIQVRSYTREVKSTSYTHSYIYMVYMPVITAVEDDTVYIYGKQILVISTEQKIYMEE